MRNTLFLVTGMAIAFLGTVIRSCAADAGTQAVYLCGKVHESLTAGHCAGCYTEVAGLVIAAGALVMIGRRQLDGARARAGVGSHA